MIITINESANIRLDLERTLGTLVVTEKGLGFKVPRGKREPEVVIPWDKMLGAIEILKNVPGFTVPNGDSEPLRPEEHGRGSTAVPLAAGDDEAYINFPSDGHAPYQHPEFGNPPKPKVEESVPAPFDPDLYGV